MWIFTDAWEESSLTSSALLAKKRGIDFRLYLDKKNNPNLHLPSFSAYHVPFQHASYPLTGTLVRIDGVAYSANHPGLLRPGFSGAVVVTMSPLKNNDKIKVKDNEPKDSRPIIAKALPTVLPKMSPERARKRFSTD